MRVVDLPPYADSWTAAESPGDTITILLMQPAVELPLIKIPHVVITQHLPSPFSLDTQATHPKNIPLDVAGQPPSPQITDPARYYSRSADAKRRLVAVVCPLFLEELRTDDATDLPYTRLEGQCECGSRCSSQGGRSPFDVSVFTFSGND